MKFYHLRWAFYALNGLFLGFLYLLSIPWAAFYVMASFARENAIKWRKSVSKLGDSLVIENDKREVILQDKLWKKQQEKDAHSLSRLSSSNRVNQNLRGMERLQRLEQEQIIANQALAEFNRIDAERADVRHTATRLARERINALRTSTDTFDNG